MQSANMIIDRLDDIDQLVSNALRDELDHYDTCGVVEQTRAFVDLRTIKDGFEAVSKKLNAVYEKYKVEKLPAAFEAAGVPTVNLDEGWRVTVSHRVHASIKPGLKEKAFAWLREQGLGDLVTETVNASTLSAAAKAMAEDNQELDPDLFTVAVLPNTSVTKTK